MNVDSQDSWILEIRQRLGSPVPRRLTPSDARAAAVLVPLFVDAGQLWTILTRRADSLPHHRGQVAFPGGASEIGEDAWQAALRETEEEVGIDQRKVLRIGELDELKSPFGFSIVPCVGAVPKDVETNLNPEEIAEIFPIPLLAFADVKVVEERPVRIDDVERTIRIYHVGRRQVWGLTARIIQNLLHRLGIDSPALDGADAES
jgi:8-oxo-dGTP pyrophosphatase MutT (NUDIX family)